MATQKKTTKKTTQKKSASNKKTSKAKKPTGKNVDYYEIKLIALLGFTILSILGLHTELIGFLGQFIKNIYFGLFSYAGYSIPYILLVAVFYKINNRLIVYRTKSIIGLSLLFLSIVFMVNILTFELISSPDLNLFTFENLQTAYTDGIELVGSGLLGTMIGRFFLSFLGRLGLLVIILMLWIISFILITNINLIDWFKHRFQVGKETMEENRKIKQQIKEEYLKESEKLEEDRIKAVEELREQQAIERSERQQEKLTKALSRVDKRLKQEEKAHKKAVEDFDAMFSQSPTKSLVDKLFKKTAVPTKEEILQAAKSEPEEESNFDMFDSAGYAFDEHYQEDQIIQNAPDIFDNHQELTIPEEDLNIPITGFGTLVEESIQKAYDESESFSPAPFEEALSEAPQIAEEIIEPDPVEPEVSSFDQAFLKASENREGIIVSEETSLFENGVPLSDEEKNQVSMFDQITGKKDKVTSEKNKVDYEESKIPDAAIEQHMSESVRLEFENYRIPKVTLLNKNNNLNKDDKAQVYEKAKLLEEILQNFNVEAKVISISKGPAITRYEIQLKPGTKMSKITNLSDDIALNLATQQVRIAAVPGKAAVGIEVPNDSTSLVTLREVLETDEFEKTDAKLSVGLGKNIAGTPIMADLGKMPHMLIAGATGSGKSVCVNTIITSILLNAKPDEVKFLMIDPKVVELNTYNGIPHLILPVVTDPKKASVALNWAVQEMTKRYNAFAEHGVRDIKGFNKKFGEDKTLFMPQIVVIIDELADLMMVAPNQVEDAICRLAQMARAAGIHLIVATQRPSVDVITGVIKANIPSRVAFAVSSAIDSRTIIDMAGAEKLLGKGDMLYYPVGSSKPQRVQGAFISDEEVEKVVSAVKNQFESFTYDETLLSNVSTQIQASSDSSEDDEHLASAIKLVVEMEQASISMLQRKFKIGYNRAARLVDEMEERGIVGPSLGSKPREVLISKAEYESM